MLLKGSKFDKKNRRYNGKNTKATAGSTAGGVSSTATGTIIRSSVTSNNRTHSNRRISHQRHQLNQSQQSTSPLSSFNGVITRNSDELGARSSSSQDVCDNSNDSGLGFEERQQLLNKATVWNGVGEEDSKRRKMDIKLESEDANFAFPEAAQGSTAENKISARNGTNGIGTSISRTGSGASTIGRIVGITRPRPAVGVLTKRAPITHQGPVTLSSQLCSVSRNGKTQLQIICQPEQQHRARYQTEGSRGAVKDRTGNGFPIVRLVGYDKPATLQVFIGTDLGRVAPHMFYQACRVSGKNSTPCVERKVDGTIVIEVDMDPAKDMLVTCDCVGILKERNVDVEHRFPQETGVLQGRSKKKSTRCRMVFRTTITHPDGNTETLQVCSQPIVCTQPPGIPEICKKSLTSCPTTGGLELFILGKNFLKDTRIVFQLDNEDPSSSMEPHWECDVLPDKEFLQQTHLVCVVPAYRRQDLAPTETISVKLFAVSSGKTSEPHTFLYTSVSTPPEPSVGKVEISNPPLTQPNKTGLSSTSTVSLTPSVPKNTLLTQGATGSSGFLSSIQQPSQQQQQQSPQQSQSEILKSDPSPPPSTPQVTPVMLWASSGSNCQNSAADVMMPPPLIANQLINRRSSSNLQVILPDNLKTEVLDENSESSMLSDNSITGVSTPTHNGATGTSPLQLVNENSLDATQSGLVRNVSVPNNGSPVQDPLLGVVDLIRNQHPLTLPSQHQTPFSGLHESSQVKVLSPHHISKDSSPILQNEGSSNGNIQGAGVVDLRMKQHQSDYNALGNFTPVGQPLPTQSGRSVENYLNQIEALPLVSASKEPESQDNNFVGAIQQRASIIATGRQQLQQQNILAATAPSGTTDTLVAPNGEPHQIVSPLRSLNTSPLTIMGHVPAVVKRETLSSPQQGNRPSPPVPVKTMLLEALLPNQQSLAISPNNVNSATTNIVPDQTPADNLLTTINAALLPSMQEVPIVTAPSAPNGTVSVAAHNPLQVSNEVMPRAPEHMQLQAISQQTVVTIQQQVQQVEQVVAQAQQQVEQVVAQAQQQAVQAVQQAQQQVVQQVFQHAHVVQQAVQQIQAVQQVQTVEVQQAVQQASQEVVQQAVQHATLEVVQQVQAVQQAVQQAQAAQAMQQAVQQDISSMLSQPAGFVAEASSALASGAAQEPCQQRLTTAAEQAISSVINNATHDIFNNKPITTTTAQAIIATKNILNSVATQSAQLMNNAMEGILPKSPSGQGNIVDQVRNKSPSRTAIPVTANRQNINTNIQNAAVSTNNPNNGRKPEDTEGILVHEENFASMSDHELLHFINPNCFEHNENFLM